MRISDWSSDVCSSDLAAPHWEYGGAGGPEHWGELSPDFQACAMGREQSPIDLRWPIPAQTGHIETAFREMPLRIVNNGHTIQVNCAPGSQSRIDGTVYDLLQFHFHQIGRAHV